MIEADIYKALGDPVRLKIITRLSGRSTHTIGKLSENLGISRQGARKQIQVLVSAELVQLKKQGRETQVLLNPDKLKMARTFITRLEQQWEHRLDALKHFVEDQTVP
ncbi:ArsR/SmtB family transcription factor [Marinicella litoralis]|uniref:ArsR family transcriptional regulator n=1 Tax=Marinicella litoralis TaxID=644220 RepID=A0A4R6XUL0_9GAMM|nr:helix-turn-helix domain-containing protein [Marinicella litoralis]TDR23516.1 ArsR family transcriptional regulator [Marinicella litoralis]